jgi:hypothetical protein
MDTTPTDSIKQQMEEWRRQQRDKVPTKIRAWPEKTAGERSRRKKGCIIAVLMAATAIMIFGLWLRHDIMENTWMGRQHTLFYKTDYQDLRNACMTVISNRHSYADWRHQAIEPDAAVPIAIWSDDPSLPVALRELRPTIIFVTESKLVAHFHHGLGCSHLGVVAFVDDAYVADTNHVPKIEIYEDPEGKLLAPGNNVCVKIIDNLWYFDIDRFYHFGASETNRGEIVTIFRTQVAKQEDERTNH